MTKSVLKVKCAFPAYLFQTIKSLHEQKCSIRNCNGCRKKREIPHTHTSNFTIFFLLCLTRQRTDKKMCAFLWAEFCFTFSKKNTVEAWRFKEIYQAKHNQVMTLHHNSWKSWEDYCSIVLNKWPQKKKGKERFSIWQKFWGGYYSKGDDHP